MEDVMARGNLHFGQNARIAAAERNVEKFRRAVLERLGYFIQATGIMCNADTVSIRAELLQYLNMGVD